MSRVPRWRSFPWWWLLLISLLVGATRLVVHLPFSPPGSLLLAWSVVQADWVRKVERRSRGVYWIMTACALYVIHVVFVLIEGSTGLGAGITLILYCVIYVVGMIVFCRDFEQLSEQPGTPSMETMTTLMAVLFGAYYFQ